MGVEVGPRSRFRAGVFGQAREPEWALRAAGRSLNRVVYILAPDGCRLACSVRATQLMKWEAFSEADFTNLKRLFQPKYASYLREEDRSIVVGLMQLANQAAPIPLLDGEYGREMLGRIVATGRAFYEFGNHVRLKEGKPLEGSLRWRRLKDGCWQPELEVVGSVDAFATNPPVYLGRTDSVFGEIRTSFPSELAMRWLRAGRMDEERTRLFCLDLARRFPEAIFPVPACARLEDGVAERPVAVLELRQRAEADRREESRAWSDLAERLRLRVRFRYGPRLVNWDAPESAVSYRAEGEIRRVKRDREREKQSLKMLEDWGFEPCESGAGLLNFDAAYFVLRPGRSWERVLTEVFPSLSADDWQVVHEPGLRVAMAGPEDCYSAIEEGEEGWFSFDMGLRHEGVRVPLLPMIHRFLRKNRDLETADLLARLESSSFAIRAEVDGEDGKRETRYVALPGKALVEVVEHLFELFDKAPLDGGDRVSVSRWRAAELASAGLVDDEQSGLAELIEKRDRLAAEAPALAEPPAGLRATLRPYQKAGLGWLRRLSEYGVNGLLADDMGLGKTVMTIAYILAMKRSGDLQNGALIVVPTSVIDNWVSELERFAPGLSLAIAHGVDRKKNWDTVLAADVAITAYSLLWRDVDALMGKRWSLLALDEAQFIKNPASKTAEAARRLEAERRLCLTGTPIENRLEDLWSQFAFLMPGYLGDEATFRRQVARPAEGAKDTELARALRERLRERLAPFILRRSKEVVLAELPKKTEVIEPVSMTPRQTSFYESVRLAMNRKIRDELAARGAARSQITVLDALLKLRQICCDPRLVSNLIAQETDVAPPKPEDSAKLTALLEQLDGLAVKGRRTLVFSQFTSMLDLIAEALRAKGQEPPMLTGRTRDRGRLVESFQEGDEPVFLISLKAGGVGLNLAEADSVIHYDPWWNPAAERQATDRAHRIGQEKPVFVYKLIAEDSIESKILRLQRSKAELAASLVSDGDASILDEETIAYLLEK